MRTGHRGFSLIELLIVVAIILIIAAIAIPNFMRSRVAANQASAIQSLRVIGTAEVTYSTTYGGGFSTNLAQLGPVPPGSQPTSMAAGLLDDLLATGVKSGYTFVYTPGLIGPAGHYNGYNIQANPNVVGQTGQIFYYTDETHVIRANALAPASSTDSPVAQ
jgi:type IV pilus assembly protein PilA